MTVKYCYWYSVEFKNLLAIYYLLNKEATIIHHDIKSYLIIHKTSVQAEFSEQTFALLHNYNTPVIVSLLMYSAKPLNLKWKPATGSFYTNQENLTFRLLLHNSIKNSIKINGILRLELRVP